MNATTITVHWHNDNQPIYLVDFQPPHHDHQLKRLVTGGGDNNIRIWHLHIRDGNAPTIDYVSTLRKHTQAVNVVRFNSRGDLLATASDDGTLMLWRRSPTIIKDLEDDEDDNPVESWQVVCQVRSSTSEINDICWSPDDCFIVTGSMDNVMRIYKLSYGSKISASVVASSSEHSHYIQGVYWDPLNQYIVSQSADRSVNIYTFSDTGLKLQQKLNKHNNHHLYYSETLQSFFRRLCFSPDGGIILTPAGMDDQENPIVYVFTRNNLGTPSFKITGLNKPAIAIAFNPIKYLSQPGLFNLPYKYIFAIATKDSIVLYSTEKLQPIGYVTNLHYSTITDLKWDFDGSKIVVSSADGFCSVVTVETGLLGEKYEETRKEEVNDEDNDVAMADVDGKEDEKEKEEKEKEKAVVEPSTGANNVDSNNKPDLQEQPVSESKPVQTTPQKPKKDTESVSSSQPATIDSFFSPNSKSKTKPKTKAKKRITPTLVLQ
jgi:chromatin assembly factor 1 subunit B